MEAEEEVECLFDEDMLVKGDEDEDEDEWGDGEEEREEEDRIEGWGL